MIKRITQVAAATVLTTAVTAQALAIDILAHRGASGEYPQSTQLAFDKALEHIRKAEADIPKKYWLNISADKETDYKEMLRQIRMKLSEKNIYDKRMMKLMFKLRCRSNPSHYECAERKEG